MSAHDRQEEHQGSEADTQRPRQAEKQLRHRYDRPADHEKTDPEPAHWQFNIGEQILLLGRAKPGFPRESLLVTESHQGSD